MDLREKIVRAEEQTTRQLDRVGTLAEQLHYYDELSKAQLDFIIDELGDEVQRLVNRARVLRDNRYELEYAEARAEGWVEA